MKTNHNMQNQLISGKSFRLTLVHISTIFTFLFASTAFAQGVSTPPVIGDLSFELTNRPDQARGMVFLPDNRLLFTDHSGTLRILDKDYKSSETLKGTPEALAPENGGTMDITLHPEFDRNSYIYFSFSETDENQERSPAIGRAELINDELRNFEIIFRQEQPAQASDLYAGRILFTPEGQLLFATGDLVIFDPGQEQSKGQNILRVDLKNTLSNSDRFAETERRERKDLMIWAPQQ